MKRLLSVLLVLGAVVAMPERIIAARSAADSDGIVASRALTGLGTVSARPRGLMKASCSSDNGDVCTCGAGSLCLSGPTGCACWKPGPLPN